MIDVERRLTDWMSARAELAQPEPAAAAVRADRGDTRDQRRRTPRAGLVRAAAVSLAVVGLGAAAWATRREPSTPADTPPAATAAPASGPPSVAASTTVSPEPVGPAVSWQVAEARFSADSFSITTNGRTFLPPADAHLNGDAAPTTPSLQVEWMDGDVEMRWYVYFATDGVDWWVSEMRIYNGEPHGGQDWLYLVGERYRTPLGQPYVGDIDADFTTEYMSGARAGRLQATGVELQGLLSFTPEDTLPPTVPGGATEASSGEAEMTLPPIVEAAATAAPKDDASADSASPSTTTALTAGEAAMWSVDPTAVSATSQTFVAKVMRLGCSGGVTGDVLPPRVELDDEAIVVTFEVAPLPPNGYECPGNDAVAYEVDVGEPIGNRPLVDGGCTEELAAAMPLRCPSGGIRWRP